jgi:hypothetical protein
VALVRDLREHRVPPSAEELAGFEAGVLARVRAGACLGGLAGSGTASASSASVATGYSAKP